MKKVLKVFILIIVLTSSSSHAVEDPSVYMDHRSVAAKSMHVNEGPKVSVLSSNYNENLQPQDKVREIPVDIHIYDIGFVVYSKKFAERFGYPDKYIADLDPGMEALEFRMKTEDGTVQCYLNTLLDNDLELDFPEHDYVNRFDGGGLSRMMRFPQKMDSFKDPKGFMGYREQQEDKEFRMKVRQDKYHYYSNNIAFSDSNYATKPNLNDRSKGGWAWGAGLLEGYSNKYLKGLDYISISTTCTKYARKNYERENLLLWFKKKGGDDYTKVTLPKPEQFLKFNIPPEFRRKASEAMKPVETYFYGEVINYKE